MASALVRADGNWVEGDRFWNRDAEIETLIERIDEGAHSLIVAYLEESQEGFVFISNLLRDWWFGRNRAFFVAAAEREA